MNFQIDYLTDEWQAVGQVGSYDVKAWGKGRNVLGFRFFGVLQAHRVWRLLNPPMPPSEVEWAEVVPTLLEWFDAETCYLVHEHHGFTDHTRTEDDQ